MSTYLNLAGITVLIMATLQSRAMQAEEARGPLADLPSEVGAHVDRIQALGDNAWLDLTWGHRRPMNNGAAPAGGRGLP